ncbi:sulfotransferase 2A1-like isoform X2 [Spea bombifrons]|uniref:sulfotransferase 2A1-like isoform X2 n=1 Tax=Spea bombifrons TaxID=233779 RepID=UPI00234B1EF0|nr:sulfotransferase 2A1-like isoform X2 [Spea bombifrons]
MLKQIALYLGTHWMVEILSLIRSNGDPSWCQKVPNWERIPWLEISGYAGQFADHQTSPRYFSSHLPIQFFPKSFFTSKAKIIYTARNPKDVLVSLYNFALMSTVIKTPHSFDELIEDFLNGTVPFGSWFDHIKGWMQMKDRNNFLFITFEELKKDHRGTVMKICKFLGKELDEEALDLVVEHSSFKMMKDNSMSNHSQAPEFFIDKNSNFLRKGISGDWRKCLTEAQKENVDKLYKEKMEGFNMKFVWDEL